VRTMGEQSKPTLFFKSGGEQTCTPVTRLAKAFLLVLLRKLGNLIFICFFFNSHNSFNGKLNSLFCLMPLRARLRALYWTPN